MSEEKAKKGNLLSVLIIILLVLILVLVGSFAAYMILGKKAANTQNTVATTVAATEAVPDLTYDLKSITVNLAEDKRYVQVHIFLGYDNKKLTAELTERDPIIRDIVNDVVSTKKSTDFTEKGKEDLKKQILDKVNPVLSKGKISDVYFNDILIQ